MKKLLLVSLVCLSSTVCFAQTDTVKKSHEEYCMIVAMSKVFSTKVIVTIDHGQATHLFGDKGMLKDEEGKAKDFNSVIDALNYMASQGWYFVNAYALTAGSGGGSVLNYVMRREVK